MVVSSHLNFLYIPDSCLNHIAARFLIAARILRAFYRLSILHIARPPSGQSEYEVFVRNGRNSPVSLRRPT